MFWIPLQRLPGRLACSARPRSPLEVEPFQMVICLLEDSEIYELELGWLKAHRLPIPDRGCPPDRRALLETLERAQAVVAEGGQVLVHCRAGIGRSPLICACLLAWLGQAEDVWDHLSRLRGVTVPDTEQQKEWFADFVRGLSAAQTLEEALRRTLSADAQRDHPCQKAQDSRPGF